MATHLLPLDLWLAWSVKGSLIILIALAAALLLHRAPAASRHLVLLVAISAQLLLPVARSLVRSETLTLPVALAIPRSANRVLAPVTAAFAYDAAVHRASSSASTRTPRKIAWRNWISAILMFGAAVALLRLTVGVVAAARVTRCSTRVDDPAWFALLREERDRLGILRAIDLRCSGKIDLPATLGSFRPVILLPTDSELWPSVIRRQVLIHELAHIRRNDFVTQLVTQVALALFWFNPLVHLAMRRMRAEAENACDDHVLRAGVRPSAYANTLVALNAKLPAGVTPFGAVAMGGPPRLEERVRAIVKPSRDSSPRNVLVVASAIALLAIVLPITAIERPVSRIVPASQSALPGTEIDCRPVYVKNAPFRETSGRLTLDDGTSSYYFFRRPEPGRCVEASFSLDARFTDDDRDVAVTAGLQALVREKRADADRTAVITESGGVLTRQFRIDGHDAQWSASADAWYHSVMPAVIRMSSAGIESRVRRILEQSGLAGLTAELPDLGDDGIREEYLAALLSLRAPAQLPREELIATAQTALRGFEPAMARLLSEIVGREGSDRSILAAVLAATEKLADGADRNTVLEAMISHSDREVRRSALLAIDLLPGDVWHRIFLDRASASCLGNHDGALIDEYFHAVNGIAGSRDRAMLLEALLSRNPSPSVVDRIALAAKEIGNSDDRAEVEAAIARVI